MNRGVKEQWKDNVDTKNVADKRMRQLVTDGLFFLFLLVMTVMGMVHVFKCVLG